MMISRRQLFGASAVLAMTALTRPSGALASVLRLSSDHPDPRPGIDASRVLTAEKLTQYPDAVPVFDMIRQIPRIADGIRCQCDCRELPDFRSLLTCFEAQGMAMHCEFCQGQARLAYRMHKAGRSLAAIRKAIDSEFGS